MMIYHPDYIPEQVEPKPSVSTAKKNAALNAVKAHMDTTRGYQIKELVEVVQAELHADDIHIKDEEVAVWIKDLDAEWGWHPVTPVDLGLEPKEK